jgi:hypothetical protein
MRLILIGCSKTKLPYRRDSKRGGRLLPAELYGGDLFKKRVAYAEREGASWAVLSAAFGLWDSHVEKNPTTSGSEPGEVYNLTICDMPPAERAAWHVSVASSIVDRLWEPWECGESPNPMLPSDLRVEIHAGRDYAQPLATILRELGIRTETPCEGLGIGEQLAMYTSGILSAV